VPRWPSRIRSSSRISVPGTSTAWLALPTWGAIASVTLLNPADSSTVVASGWPLNSGTPGCGTRAERWTLPVRQPASAGKTTRRRVDM